jgi:ABC-type antimicrobial peptide transport system permease subunit
MEIMMRTRVPPVTLGHAIRQEVQALDEDLAVPSLRTLDDSLWLRNWRYRVFGSMFAIFAGIALVLASVGLYAVIAHSVSQRTREIGVRMALGALTGDILGLVFRQGLQQMVLGLAVGLAAALWVTRVLGAMLVGVTPTDPLTFASVALLLILAGTLGCAIPARRAIRVDPVVALRNE